ncbi:MAG: hypothetical protein Q8P67_27070, partial [archaeon]|nr:hypothetical protein [archaeon]
MTLVVDQHNSQGGARRSLRVTHLWISERQKRQSIKVCHISIIRRIRARSQESEKRRKCKRGKNKISLHFLLKIFCDFFFGL